MRAREIRTGNFITGWRCTGIAQTDARVTASFAALMHDTRAASGRRTDGLRRHPFGGAAQYYPDEGAFVYRGTNLWRGVTRMVPYLTGASIARIGARHSTLIHLSDPQPHRCGGAPPGQLGGGDRARSPAPVDWNKPGRLEDFLPVYQDGISTGSTCRR